MYHQPNQACRVVIPAVMAGHKSSTHFVNESVLAGPWDHRDSLKLHLSAVMGWTHLSVLPCTLVFLAETLAEQASAGVHLPQRLVSADTLMEAPLMPRDYLAMCHNIQRPEPSGSGQILKTHFHNGHFPKYS